METKNKEVQVIATPLPAHTLASELNVIEGNIALLDRDAKFLRERLLSSLQAQGVRRVDLENGDSYVVYPRNKLVIKDKMAAQKWGIENPEARMKLDNAVAIDVALSGKLKWAKVEKEEYLRISRKKNDHESDE